MMKKIIATVLAALLAATTFSAQAQQRPGKGLVTHVQSDGRTLTYKTVGSKAEGFWAQTLDGYTLWHTATGDIVYATTDADGRMVASTVLAADQRTEAERAFVASLPQGLPIIPLPPAAGHLLAGSHFQHSATRSDSLLVILVQFADEQLTHPASTFDSLFSQPGYNGTGSFKDYYFDQSGGRFDPGVRVVGPVTMPNNKDYYNQTSWLGSNAQTMVKTAISLADSIVDYSHFDNDGNGVVDAVLIFYTGEMPESKSQGLWPHQNSVTGAGTHDGKGFSHYAIFDEGTGMPTIGTVCHEFGHVLGLPDLYDACHDGTDAENGRHPNMYSLMASGNHNAGGKLPPNMSVLEKSLLGWGAQFDTLQPADSISLRAIGTANDRAYFIPIDGNEFLALEVRSGSDHWDGGIYGIGEGGMLVYHGKESKLNTTSNNVINCTVGDEGWYVVRDEVFGKASGTSTLTPHSLHKPMKNDSTVVNNIWLYNIRWTSDSTMAFTFSRTRPNATIVEEGYFDNGTDVSDSGFTARAAIIGTSGTLQAKGIVYSSTPEGCTMTQGTVVYDNTLGDDTSINATASGITPGFYWFSVFVQDGNGLTMLPPQKVVTRLIAIDSVYTYTGNQNGILHVVLASHCSNVYIPSIGYNANNRKTAYPDAERRFDVSGPIEDYRHGISGASLYAVSTDGDTVAYYYPAERMSLLPTRDLDNYDWQYYGTSDIYDLAVERDAYLLDDSLVVNRGNCVMPETGGVTEYYVASMNRQAIDSIAGYYETKIEPGTTLNRRMRYVNNSIYHAVSQQSAFVTANAGDTVQFPRSGDSVLLMAWLGAAGQYQYNIVGIVPEPDGRATIVGFTGDGTRYYTDTLLLLQCGVGVERYDLICGGVGELAARGITDTTTALLYSLEHPDQVLHCTGHPSLYKVMTHALPGTDTSFAAYAISYNTYGDRELSQILVNLSHESPFRILRWSLYDEDGYYIGEDPLWCSRHMMGENTVIEWRGELKRNPHYDYLKYDQDYYVGVFRAGTTDSLMQAMGLSEAGLMQWLLEQNKISRSWYWRTDTLQRDMMYEVCAWSVMTHYDPAYYGRPLPWTSWADTLFQRTTFFAQVPADWLLERKYVVVNSSNYDAGEVVVSSPHEYGGTHAVGDTVTLTFIPTPGFTINLQYLTLHPVTALDTLTFGDTTVIHFIMPDQIVSLVAHWDSIRYEILDYVTERGGVWGGAYVAGSQVTVRAWSSEHYHFVQWADGSTTNPFTYTMEAHDTMFVALFEGDIEQVTAESYPPQAGTVAGMGSYHYGDTAVLVATPNPGWNFRQWTAGHGGAVANNNNYVAGGDTDTLRYQLTDPYYWLQHYNHFVARFDWDSVIINAQVNDPSLGSVSGGGTYLVGSVVTLEVDLEAGCYMEYWEGPYIGNPSVNPLVFEAPVAVETQTTCTYTAHINCNHELTLLCDSEQGRVEGSGTYEHGSAVSVAAIAKQGYTFKQWDNGVLVPGYYLTLTSDSTVTALFEPITSIDNVEGTDARITVKGMTISVEAIEGQKVEVYDMEGRLLAARSGSLHFHAPASGTYFVKVADQPARRVVVAR